MSTIELEQGKNNNAAVLEKITAPLKNKSPKYKVLLHNDPVNSMEYVTNALREVCLLYTSPSPRDLSTSRMPSSA